MSTTALGKLALRMLYFSLMQSVQVTFAGSDANREALLTRSKKLSISMVPMTA
jgi:hypothetical protein